MDPLSKLDTAPAVLPGLAKATKNLWQQGLDKKKLQEKLAGSKIPSNCDFLTVPRTNEQVFLSAKDQNPQLTSKDVQLQNTQKILASTALPVLGMLETLLKLQVGTTVTDEVRQALLQQATDAFTLLSHNNTRLLQQRKDLYAHTFATDIKSVRLINEPDSKELFGDNFPEKVQAARKAYYAMHNSKQKRSHPYRRTNTSSYEPTKNDKAQPTKSSGKGQKSKYKRYYKNQKKN